MLNMQQYGEASPTVRGDRGARADRVPDQNQRNQKNQPNPRYQVAPGTRHIGRPAGVENKGGQTSVALSHVGANVAVGTFPNAGCKSHCAIMICDQDENYGAASQGCRGLAAVTVRSRRLPRLSKYEFLLCVSGQSIVSISCSEQGMRGGEVPMSKEWSWACLLNACRFW